MADAAESIGILQFALDAVVDQQQTIANNISNQDTPNFQADDVTFESSLAAGPPERGHRQRSRPLPKAWPREPTATTSRCPPR